METVNAWIGAVLGGIAIVAAIAGAMRWMLHIGLKQVQIIVDQAVDAAMAGQAGRFNSIDQRFGRIDHHVATIDQRFEQIDQHFAAIDQRFEQIDQHFAAIDQRFEQIDHHFAAIDQRFEQIDHHFAIIDQRFEQIDQRLATIDAELQRLDTKVDHLAEVVDLRMRPLEVDMGLLKQHLLGTPAA